MYYSTASCIIYVMAKYRAEIIFLKILGEIREMCLNGQPGIIVCP